MTYFDSLTKATTPSSSDIAEIGLECESICSMYLDLLEEVQRTHDALSNGISDEINARLDDIVVEATSLCYSKESMMSHEDASRKFNALAMEVKSLRHEA
ncbi:hypothetical protein [Lacipirellula sp.]|uniref:hypothetical protein n=1 Tax=Lacipirellula sp. TaxID=2691419 RepID=UPI003D0AB516